MTVLAGIAAGICLSAAAGFRVFVPFLVMSLAARAGLIGLSGDFAWLASDAALIVLGAATVVEIAAYYIPWVDNLLDVIATPVAVAAGTVASLAVIMDLPPLFEWFLAIVIGGGVAGAVQGGTALTRGVSTAATGGTGNPAVSTGELGGAVGASLLGVFLPVAGGLLILGLLGWMLRRLRRSRRSRDKRYIDRIGRQLDQ